MDKQINKLFAKAGIQIKKTSSLENEQQYFIRTIGALQELYSYRFQNGNMPFNEEILGLVFSKNRAMQLHALLGSYFHYTKNSSQLKVLYTATGEDYLMSYKNLQREFREFPVEFILETNFKNDVQSLVGKTSADRIFFMTDDAIFSRHYDLSDVLHFNPFNEIFSLRLGKDMGYSFAYQQEQSLPDFQQDDAGQLKTYSWIWGDMKESPDWCYPLSLDGTFFGTNEIAIILNFIDFKNPNSLEASLQLFNSIFLLRKGICYENAKYVNIPCNIVQQDFKNIYTGAFDVAELLALFMAGKRIDWLQYAGNHPKEIQQSKFTFT
ncbi:MAG: hypothetical protein ABJA78_20530 [Ferruginibacter sp.]